MAGVSGHSFSRGVFVTGTSQNITPALQTSIQHTSNSPAPRVTGQLSGIKLAPLGDTVTARSPPAEEEEPQTKTLSKPAQPKRPRLIKVYARLPAHCPYVGTFHYAPSAKNRSRNTFFEHLIIPEEFIERLHLWKADPMIGAIVRGSAYYTTQSHSAVFSRTRAEAIHGKKIRSRSEPDEMSALGFMTANASLTVAISRDCTPSASLKNSFTNLQDCLSPELEKTQKELKKYFSKTQASEANSKDQGVMQNPKPPSSRPKFHTNSPHHLVVSKNLVPHSKKPVVEQQSAPSDDHPQGPRFVESRPKENTWPAGSFSLVPLDVFKESTGDVEVRSREPSLLNKSQLCNSPIRMIGGEEELKASGQQMYQCFLSNEETHVILKRRMAWRKKNKSEGRANFPGPMLNKPYSANKKEKGFSSTGHRTPVLDKSSTLESISTFGSCQNGEEVSDSAFENLMGQLSPATTSPRVTFFEEEGRLDSKNSPLTSSFASGEPTPRMRAHTYDWSGPNAKELPMFQRDNSQSSSTAEMDTSVSKGAGFRTATKMAQTYVEREKTERKSVSLKGAVPYVVQDERQLGQYTVQKDQEFGEGSYAAVYLATHNETKVKVAIKQIKKNYLFSEEEKASVWREIENHQRASNHINITKLFEIFETPDHINMVIELADCGSLEKMLSLRRSLSELEVKRVTKQLLEGLVSIHSSDMVHLDLKPANILFAHDPEVQCETCGNSLGDWNHKQPGAIAHTSPSALRLKICDFGFSRKVPDVRYFKTTGDVNKIPFQALTGTEQYMAPEILLKEPYGKPADMWSVGVILYKMLSGAMPFIPTRACFARRPVYTPYVWDKYSLSAKDIVDKLLTVDPESRMTAVEALQHPWLESVYHLKVNFPHFKICPAASPRAESK